MSDERKTDVPNPNVIGPETDGRSGAVTGFDTPDPKDNHAVVYTTTPGDDRVGSSDQMQGAPPQASESGRDVTGKYDHLATRDVRAMEHTLESPEFAGAETVAGLGGEALDEVVPTAGLGVHPAAALAPYPLDNPDQNPGYTPPSEKVVPHVREQPGDLPPGEPTELQSEIGGTDLGDRDRNRR